MYKIVLFDLDGTLTDSAQGIMNSIVYALKKWDIDVSDRSSLYKFIGPPLIGSFEKYYGFSYSKAEQTVKYFREYFTQKGMFENRVFEGVTEMLDSIKAAGIITAVATSKPEIFAKTIIEHFGLSKYFDLVAGAATDETRVKKDAVIEYALHILERDHTACSTNKIHTADSCGMEKETADTQDFTESKDLKEKTFAVQGQKIQQWQSGLGQLQKISEMPESLKEKTFAVQGQKIQQWQSGLEQPQKKSEMPEPDIIMIGDRKDDIEAAKKFGLASMACLWGYGTENELKNAEPDFFAASPAEAGALILR